MFLNSLSAPVRFALEKLPRHVKPPVIIQDDTLPAQGYERRVSEDEVRIKASDDAGFMYGILDLAELYERNQDIGDLKVTPYIRNRGIKFNIPLDARTPSYTDAGTSAWKNIANMWDLSFWEEYLDWMAECRYNVLTLWTESLFPSLVRIPEYPLACIDDVKISMRPVNATTRGLRMYDTDMYEHLVTVRKMSIDEKISFWRQVMAYAHDRCIDVYFFTWNVFSYGTENNPYGITDDMFNPVTRDYYYHGVQAIIDTYPLLKGIGITAGENMAHEGGSVLSNDPAYKSEDVKFTLETYGYAVRDYLKNHPDRAFVLIHRMQMARYRDIYQAFAETGIRTDISFKYSLAHMYSSPEPKFISEFLSEKAPDTRFWLTVRNDDFYYLRWGDPDFSREYIRHMPADSMEGFYMGADGLIWARDYSSRDKSYTPLFTKKMWYMFSLWGKLSYNHELPNEYFIDAVASKFGLQADAAVRLFQCWQKASRIIPEVTKVHWNNYDFQWYPEGCCYRDDVFQKIVFADVREFMERGSMPGSGYESMAECAHRIAAGTDTEQVTVFQAADKIEECVQFLRDQEDFLNSLDDGSEELRETVSDLLAMADLGAYYAKKIKAAVFLLVCRENGDEKQREESIRLLELAARDWTAYAERMYAAYKPQVLSRLGAKIDFTDFEDLASMDVLTARDI